jgi:cob(I)alamin adenosyltransferase
MRKGGFVHLYTGEGEGKTTNALGLALRALGHGYKVIIIQFMKGRKNIGEYKVKGKLGSNYEIYQFGRRKFIDLYNPGPEDTAGAQEALEFAEKQLKSQPKVLILDEINLAAAFKLIDVKDVLELLDKIPEDTTVVLTGRRAPKELIDRADLVTEMLEVKHPMAKGVSARKGIEY